MDQLAPEQEEAIAATVGAIQRIAMAIVALPKEERAARYLSSKELRGGNYEIRH